jgi:hypothetical protein
VNASLQKSKLTWWTVGLLLISLSSEVKAEALRRTEIPINEVVLKDGIRRYVVSIKIGRTSVEAGLDTGSSGLRLLPKAVSDSDVVVQSSRTSETYDSGTKVSGFVARATVTIGEVSAGIPLQLIDDVRCTHEVPDCPASNVSISDFGLQGDGIPGAGFRAILGINTGPGDMGSTLASLGVSRWVVVLPRPNSTPGKLILNPRDDEVAGFARLPIAIEFRAQKDGIHDAVKGCILDEKAERKACGALMMDTGAPGIDIVNGGLGTIPWPNGTKAALGFFGAKKIAAGEYFIVGLRYHASRLTFSRRPGVPDPIIYAGISPYFAFDVLYEPGSDRIGLKPRPESVGYPSGVAFGEDSLTKAPQRK